MTWKQRLTKAELYAKRIAREDKAYARFSQSGAHVFRANFQMNRMIADLATVSNRQVFFQQHPLVIAQGRPGVHQELSQLAGSHFNTVYNMFSRQLESAKRINNEEQLDKLHALFDRINMLYTQYSKALDKFVLDYGQQACDDESIHFDAHRQDIIGLPCTLYDPVNQGYLSALFAANKHIAIPFFDEMLAVVNSQDQAVLLETWGVKKVKLKDLISRAHIDRAEMGSRAPTIYASWDEAQIGEEEEKVADVRRTVHQLLYDRTQTFNNLQLLARGILREPNKEEKVLLEQEFKTDWVSAFNALTDEELVGYVHVDFMEKYPSAESIWRVRTHGTTSHSRNEVSEAHELQGLANAFSVNKFYKGTLSIQFMRRASLTPYLLASSPDMGYWSAALNAQLEALAHIAAHGRRHLADKEYKESNVLEVSETYVQLVSPIQSAAVRLDTTDHGYEQMLHTAFIIGMMDGYQGPMLVEGKKVTIRANLDMFCLGINEFGGMETAIQKELNEQAMYRMRTKVVSYLDAQIANQYPELHLAIREYMRCGMDTKAMHLIADEVKALKEELSIKRAEFMRELNTRPENKDKVARLKNALQKLVTKIRQQEAAFERVHRDTQGRNSRSVLDAIAAELGVASQPLASKLKGLANIIHMYIDAERLYRSGQWSSEQHQCQLQSLIININHQLNQAATGNKVNLASTGCKSNHDRGGTISVNATALGDAVTQSEGGLYTGLDIFTSPQFKKAYTTIVESGAERENNYAQAGCTCGKNKYGDVDPLTATYAGKMQKNGRLGGSPLKSANKEAFKSFAKFVGALVLLTLSVITAPLRLLIKRNLDGIRQGWISLKAGFNSFVSDMRNVFSETPKSCQLDKSADKLALKTREAVVAKMSVAEQTKPQRAKSLAQALAMLEANAHSARATTPPLERPRRRAFSAVEMYPQAKPVIGELPDEGANTTGQEHSPIPPKHAG